MPNCNGAFVGAFYGEAGRGRPPACPHLGPLVPHLSNGPVSGCATEKLSAKGTRTQSPLVCDGAMVHLPSLCVPGANHSSNLKRDFKDRDFCLISASGREA